MGGHGVLSDTPNRRRSVKRIHLLCLLSTCKETKEVGSFEIALGRLNWEDWIPEKECMVNISVRC